MENITLGKIHKDLEQLKKVVFEIKTNIIDVDSVFSQDDFVALENYAMEKKKGILISHEGIKKELGL